MTDRSQPWTGQDGQSGLSRRALMGKAVAAAAVPLLAGAVASAGQAQPKPATPAKPAEFKRKIKFGLVGCGGRGTWLAGLFKKHGGYEMHAVADYFPDAADAAGQSLGVDKSRRFTGLGSCQKLIDSGVEAVVILDVPCFYAEQAKAAIGAGRHVYMAKPIAADVPGCLAIGELGKEATAKKLCFLVDYQLPLEPANIEVAKRIRAGALGPMAHIISFGFSGAWSDPPKGKTIEGRLRGEVWLSDVALGGDNIVSFDIHIIDGVVWVMGKRPTSACGRSRICRADPHGDRTDCGGVVWQFDDGVIWTHVMQALNNNADMTSLSASLMGLSATAHIQYGGKVYVRGGDKHYAGNCGSIYDDGATRNIAAFYQNITEGHFQNATVQRAVDGTLTAILGREASARGCMLTMEQLIKENKKLEVDLTGLKA